MLYFAFKSIYELRNERDTTYFGNEYGMVASATLGKIDEYEAEKEDW